MRQFTFKKSSDGFTLTELLIVIAILIIILILVIINLRTQILKSHDSVRKADLARIQKSFEEYFNDHECYPFDTVLQTCKGTQLQPYVREVPCDPTTKLPYLYVPGTPTYCVGYHLCAKLENLNDPDIARIGCDPVQGCGWGAGYNYCVAIGSGVVAPNFNPGPPSPTPTPTPYTGPTPPPGQYACERSGACNSYTDPASHGCPVTFADPNCIFNGTNWCTILANRCNN